MTRPSVAMFGLGALGAVLAARLHAAGCALAAHDPRPAALAAHRSACGADTVRAAEAQVHVSCVTDESAAEQLYFAPGGWAESLRPGCLAIDHTTTGPAFARRAAAALAARGVGFVDAPLSGGVGGARAGRLLALLGGAAADRERAAPVLAAYCARQVAFGPAGSGQAAKLANQLCIAGTLAGLDAAAAFARANALDVGQLFAALAAGSASSAQMEQHAPMLAAADAAFGERFGWIAKDLALALESAAAAPPAAALAGWVLACAHGAPAGAA
ncbi:MAG: NAD(P)-dependent oxidoreductase [Burkholderiales bacterium]|nr:NAD(P)-dependent oxidoreductase [Burkholderiales bacterium]